MPYQITEHQTYLRAVISDSAPLEEFVAFYRELRALSTDRGFDRALVVVTPNGETPAHERLAMFGQAGFIEGFKLALICATWTLYQACNKAERAASQAGIHVRAFLQEMEGVNWLTGSR